MADSKFTNFRRRRRSRVDYVHFSEHFGNNEPGNAHRRGTETPSFLLGEGSPA